MEKVRTFFAKRPIETYVFLLSFLAFVFLFSFSALRFPNDDQFILYRYIDNIVNGDGFVFNIGEKVLGATTPLFTIVCAAAKFIFRGVSTPAIVAWLNILFMSFSAVYFFKISRFFISNKYSLLATTLFVLNLSKTIPEGMETPLFLLFVFMFLYYLLFQKHDKSAVLLGLAILTRPDAGLIAVLAAIFWLIKVGFEKAVKLCCLVGLTMLPWLLFSLAYFDTIIPQSLLTKIHASDTVYMPRYQAFKIELANISRLYWGSIIDFEIIWKQILFNLLPTLALIAFAVKKKLTRDNWIVFAIPVIYFISFGISNPVMFPWYISQVEPFWILLSFIGLTLLVEKLKSAKARYALILLFLIVPVMSYARRSVTDETGTKTALFTISEYLNQNRKPSETVGLSNIGIVSYLTGAYIVDFIGLTNSYSVTYYPIPGNCVDKTQLYTIPPKLIQDTRPDWLIAGDGEMEPCFHESKWFKEHYVLMNKITSVGIYKYK